jgi:hypothetical protein
MGIFGIRLVFQKKLYHIISLEKVTQKYPQQLRDFSKGLR